MTLVVAALLHAPLLPLNLFRTLSFWLEARDVELAEVDGEAIIPIDLDLTTEQDPVAAPAPSAPSSGATEAAVSSARPVPKPTNIPDAGVDASEVYDEDAAAPPAARPDAGLEAEATIDAGKSEQVASASSAAPNAGPSAVRDPFAVAGGPSALAKTDNNVKILIASDRIRSHELGTQFGQLLTSLPEWRSFFEGTQLDPIRDFDHLLISGPQLRDSRRVVAVMDYNVPEARVHGAIDLLVDKSKPRGEWIADSAVPAAIAKADRGERIFAMVPSRRILAVLPPELKDQLGSLKSVKPFNKSSAVAIVLFLVTPSRAFRGSPVKIPDTLKWLRLSVTPTADGGVDLLVEALDAAADQAATHAPEINDGIEQLRKPDLGPLAGFANIELFDPVKLTADGATIRGRSHMSKAQLRRIMGFVQAYASSKGASKPAPSVTP